MSSNDSALPGPLEQTGSNKLETETSAALTTQQISTPTRRSTRDIKRKKFDDEIIGASSFSGGTAATPVAMSGSGSGSPTAKRQRLGSMSSGSGQGGTSSPVSASATNRRHSAVTIENDLKVVVQAGTETKKDDDSSATNATKEELKLEDQQPKYVKQPINDTSQAKDQESSCVPPSDISTAPASHTVVENQAQKVESTTDLKLKTSLKEAMVDEDQPPSGQSSGGSKTSPPRTPVKEHTVQPVKPIEYTKQQPAISPSAEDDGGDANLFDRIKRVTSTPTGSGGLTSPSRTATTDSGSGGHASPMATLLHKTGSDAAVELPDKQQFRSPIRSPQTGGFILKPPIILNSPDKPNIQAPKLGMLPLASPSTAFGSPLASPRNIPVQSPISNLLHKPVVQTASTSKNEQRTSREIGGDGVRGNFMHATESGGNNEGTLGQRVLGPNSQLQGASQNMMPQQETQNSLQQPTQPQQPAAQQNIQQHQSPQQQRYNSQLHQQQLGISPQQQNNSQLINVPTSGGNMPGFNQSVAADGPDLSQQPYSKNQMQHFGQGPPQFQQYAVQHQSPHQMQPLGSPVFQQQGQFMQSMGGPQHLHQFPQPGPSGPNMGPMQHLGPMDPGSLPPIPPPPVVPISNTAFAVAPNRKPTTAKTRKRKQTQASKRAGAAGANIKPEAEEDALSKLRNVGRWSVMDDLALVTAVLQTSDLDAIHKGVKFSCKFSLEEIHQRWYCLLYDKAVSQNAMDAMKRLNPEVTVAIQSKTLFSKAEEDVLKSIHAATAPPPQMGTFESILLQRPDVFHPARTPRVLLAHWQSLKQYQLLNDQKPMPQLMIREGGSIVDPKPNFSDVEDNLLEEIVEQQAAQRQQQSLQQLYAQPSTLSGLGSGARRLLAEVEKERAARVSRNEIRVLENEIPKLQVLVESITGVSPPSLDSQTLAVLRGRVVRYLMRSRKITLGRSGKNNVVDIDVSLEGPAWKVSRKQATIRMKPTGEFCISNEGSRPLMIDGTPLITGATGSLNHNSIVEISCLRFIFLINQDLINTVRSESIKMMIV